MKILSSIQEMKSWRREHNGTIGLVPTMGALHQGHSSLIEASKKHNDKTVVSIFVNPTQFNSQDDLKTYPRTETADIRLLQQLGVDAVFLPVVKEIYASGFDFAITENNESKILCGAHRPGHFDGVLTVVAKLFNIVEPDHAYFGEKDFQQLRLVSGMVQALNIPVDVVACPTLREADGLAISSRNVRLSPMERELAAQLPQVLKKSASAAAAQSELRRLGFEVDYVEDLWGRRLTAVHLGKVRLIDNVEI